MCFISIWCLTGKIKGFVRSLFDLTVSDLGFQDHQSKYFIARAGELCFLKGGRIGSGTFCS